MTRRQLPLGTAGEIQVTPQARDTHGRWKTHPSGKGKGVERWRARAYYRGHDGVVVDVARFASRRAEAVAKVETALADRLRIGSGTVHPNMPLIEAGREWLTLIDRTDSGKSARTVADYRGAFGRYLDAPGSAVRGLTLRQVNEPARIRGWLQAVADAHGTSAAKQAKSVLSGILTQAVNDGVLPTNASRQVRPVKAQRTLESGSGRRKAQRDTETALTREQRDAIIAHADARVTARGLIPRTRAKHLATADLLAFMAGTGARVSEARALRWDHVDLGTGAVQLHGTKSKTSKRMVNLPGWLSERLTRRAAESGGAGFVFPAPAANDPERQWDQSNAAGALAAVLTEAGYNWATPHTLRRTVATLLHQQGVPIARIADQLGHSDPSMTARVYLGRDFEGDKSDLAALL